MYSVEDLLISHGYKPSRDQPAARKDSSQECQPARSRTRAGAGQGLLNGYEDGCARSRTSVGTGHLSDSESRRSTPRGQGQGQGHGERQRASASRAPEAGFYNQPALAWSCQPQVGSSHTYWRRGQEGSDSLAPRDREDLEVRGMAQAHSLPVRMREGPWEVAGRTEHVTKKAIWEEELRMPGPAKWQHVGLESWKHPRKLGRQMSDGDGEKLFQDLYPFIQGEHMLTPQNKKKSQSLPRVLSPEGLSCTEIPIPLRDGHFPGTAKMSPYPPSCAPPLEPGRNPDRGGSSGPFPQPKFGKPLKPPSYGSHQQQSRGGEGHFQDRQHLDTRGSLPTRNDPRQELGVSEPGLEPPVYVPPPSYRSPPEHIPNPYLEDPVPRHVSGGHSQLQHVPEKVRTGCPLPSGSLAAGSNYGASPGSPPRGFPAHPHPIPAYDGSVEYIPFDDPRIRHIKLAQPPGFCEEAKFDDRSYSSGLMTAQEPAPGRRQCDSALLPPRDLIVPSGHERGPAFASASPRWLRRQLPGDGENGGFPGHPDQGVVRGLRTDGRDSQPGGTGGHASSPHSQAEGTCESHTKLRKFEAGIQTKKSSKKKTSETIFCLVSIPVKSEPPLPATDRNNNDLKPRADTELGPERSALFPEPSLLSMSSTDLELQALTGSLAGRRELPKQDLGEPEDSEQTDDLRFILLTKHRGLQPSGLWPGHQHRDQQTQTSFPEDAKSSQCLPAAESIPKCLDLTTPKAHPHVALTSGESGDLKQKPSGSNLRGQTSLSPSSNSAFSRTSSGAQQASVPRGDPGQPCVGAHGQGPKPEVVKGEPAAGPCNSRQLFGQFLLKPVSRRPWDLISQLESFNKELQEEEENHRGGSSEESETEQQEDRAHATPRTQAFHETSQEMRGEQRPRPRVLELEDPGFQAGRIHSKSENCTEEPPPHHPSARPQSPGPSLVEDHPDASLRQVDRGLPAEQPDQRVVNGVYEPEPAVSPGPTSRRVASRPGRTKAAAPSSSSLAEERASQELRQFRDASGAVQLGRGPPPEVDGNEERGPVVPLSLANKNRGLSAPDLRSLGLVMGQEQSACNLEESLGLGSASEITPSESLQERAVRILGIEVAVESLLPSARRAGQSPSPEPDVSACSPPSPREDSLPSSAPSAGPTVTTDAFYGRRKCGWTESPLFVGERAPQLSLHSDVDGVPCSQAATPEPELSPSSECKAFEEKDAGTKPPFRATLFHFIERTPSVAGSEKRLRSPSKVIESLQEKLTSPPTRADPDRLMRMKEVSSVSRMRSLSFRSADSTSTEEAQAWQPGGLTSLSTGDRPWRASASKGDISREESRHLTAQREKVDQDFWSPDSYDPSRVERV